MNMIFHTPGLSVASDASLAALRQRILASDLPERRRQVLASALNTIGKALRRPLETIPADPARLRPMLAGVTPAMARLTVGSWKNAQSHLGAALALVHPDMLPRRFDLVPSPAWAAHLERLRTGPHEGYHLGRFARYATRLGIDPEAVDDALLDRYRRDLTQRSLVAEPARVARDTTRAWNAAAARDLDWPQQRLAVHDNRVRYSLPWNRYPASLRQEIDRWLDRLGRDPLAPRKVRALRPASITAREQQLALYLGALVETGDDPATMTCLAAVVTPAHVERVLRVIHARNGERITSHLAQIASLALMLARYWIRLPENDIEELKDLARNCRPQTDGLAPRNTERLAQLNDPARLAAVLSLPLDIEARVRRAGPPTLDLARMMQTAVAIEILLMTGLRIGNLAELAIGQSLRLRQDGGIDILVEPARVKNRVPLVAELTGGSAALVRRYIKDYRPLLGDAAAPWLFPGKQPGTAKTTDGLRQQITRAMAEIAGVEWHVHAFRHLLAKIQLDAQPGSDGIVTRALGHKRADTARQHYSGYATAAAIRHYDELLLARRATLLRPRRGRR